MARLVAAFRGKQLYLRSGMTYSVERLAYSVAGILVYIALGRALDPAAMGAFNFAQTAANMAGPFLAVGAEAVIVRELVRNPRDGAVILGSGFRILLINSLGVMTLPVLFVWATLGNDRDALAMTIWFVLPFLFNGFFVIDHYLRARLLPRPLVVARLLSIVLGLAIKLGALLAGFSVVYVAAGSAIEQAALILLLILTYRRLPDGPRKWTTRTDTVRLLFRQCIPAMVAAVVVQLFFRINSLMLGSLSSVPEGGLSETGQYAVAFQIIQLTNMLPAAVFPAIYPRLVALQSENPQRYEEVLRRLLVWMTLLGYGLAAGAYMFAHPVLNLVLGGKFDRAADILLVLCASTIFNFSGAVRAQFINIEGTTHYHMISAALGLVVLVPADLYLIPLHGALGAAWSAVAATFVSGVLSSLLFRRTRAFGLSQLLALLMISRPARH